MAGLTPPPEHPKELPDLVLEWPSLQALPVGGRALGISVFLHAAAIAVLALLPRTEVAPATYAREFQAGTTLVAPPFELTQKAPNQGKVGREFNLDSLLPRPPLRAPKTIPRTPAAPSAPPEPPKVDTRRFQAGSAPPPDATALPAPPPQIQPEETPKLAFETPAAAKMSGHGLGRLAPPSDSISEAVRAAARPGAGRQAVGDNDLSSGIGGLSRAPAAGRAASALEMISDPMGVDFKPYLIQILAIVKRNWLAVIPETARLGRQGRVQIQFAVNRDGSVPKLVIAVPSGTESLDRAAVTGVSASNPFPPLPSDFHGDQVRLQFTFSYNMK
jgi:TonB family protein